MKYLFILTLFISQTIVSQNKINESDYVNFIYEFLEDNSRDKNSYILNVHYYHDSNLVLNHLKSLKNKSEIKGHKVDINEREIRYFINQTKKPYLITSFDYNDLNVQFIENRKTFYDNINKKVMLKKIDIKEARFLKKQILTFSQPIFTLDKKTAFISYSLSNTFSIIMYKIENNKWKYKTSFYHLIGCN